MPTIRNRSDVIGELSRTALLSDADAATLRASATPINVLLATGAAVVDAAVVTTVGANIGTAAAGLTLIGATDTTDQAANLMNDLVALQEDILDVRTQLNAALAELRTLGVIAT